VPTWNSPHGPLDLLRWPPRLQDPLQAWDGSDRYLLEALQELEQERPELRAGPVLVVDDAFGALGCALAERAMAWGDSELGRLALEANCARNDRPAPPWTPASDQPPEGAAVALVRLPRSQRRLGYLLARLAPVLSPGTPVLLGARSKEVQKSTVRQVEAVIGPARSTLARHRSRLIRAERDSREVSGPDARTWQLGKQLQIRALPGVFGEQRLDGGSRLLLDSVESWPEVEQLVDLGCGAGPLGLSAAALNPQARVLFCDASHLAVASARQSFGASELTNEVRFRVTDVLEGEPDESADLVLLNPPFHQGRAITRGLASRMFSESARVLRPTGRLLMVGNRHLGYHVGLRAAFAQVELLGSDPRFVVLEGRRPRSEASGPTEP